MKLKMIFFIIISILIIPSITLAMNETLNYLGITELRTEDTENIGYAIENINSNSKLEKIWNIVKYSGQNANDPTEDNFYLLKAGVGFSDTHRKATYDKQYNLKTDKIRIEQQNEVLSQLLNGGYYNNLLALIDIMYIPEEGNLEEKNSLLEAAKINKDEWDFELTNSDIEAVQQVAIWYFSNYGEYEDISKLQYTTNGTTYKNLSLYKSYNNQNTNEGEQKQKQAEILYKYLIETAKTNASNYENKINLEEPITINTVTLESQTAEQCYIIGPINITQNNNLQYNINLNITNQDNINITDKIILLDENKNETNKTAKELVGKDFYIQVPKEGTTTLNLDINAIYKTTNITLYASSTNNKEEPVILIEKEEKNINVPLKVTPEQKVFDLSMRKYITKINGIELENKRVPSIEEDKLNTATTAAYKHRKDPVVIESGDVITYKLTIYNEGQKVGKATKIVNQLPEGLKFNKVISGNFEKLSYDETTNRLELSRKEINTNNLEKYDAKIKKLSSETIEIECIVTAKENTENEQILTSVAWIKEAYNVEDNIIINNLESVDRDSNTSIIPDVNKDNIANFKGNENKEDLTDCEYYYKSQEDDEDFEKLIILPKQLDLKLIKRIEEVNGEKVEERIKEVNINTINTVNAQSNIVTTGNYKINKEPVSVKKGDIIKYTFTIYNEGDIDGYASEITEYIPEGLEFIYLKDVVNQNDLSEEEKKAIEFNNSMLWQILKTDENMKVTQVITPYLSRESEIEKEGNLIKALKTTKNEQNNISYKEVSIMLKVISDDVTGTIITNESAISKCSDKNGNNIIDRDSNPEQFIRYEDDEDYDRIKLQSFDLTLKNFIIAISKEENINKDDYLKNTNGSYIRAPQVDTTKLNTKDENQNTITTAIYNNLKDPVQVVRGDNVIYMLRVYNEGEIAGYASEIRAYLPQYLEFVDGEFNEKYGWEIMQDEKCVKTTYLENSKIPKAIKNEQETIVLNYKEVPIMCRVTQNAITNEEITLVSEITDYKDEYKKDINDRDSQEGNVDLQKYEEINQDDEDFEKVIIKRFDMALRNFITEINDNQIGLRTPQVNYNKENNHITYNHLKEPVEVVWNDIITYTIRVFNEGEVEGHASEIENNIPQGLEFLPEDEVNKTYKWKMIDSEGNETNEVKKAVKITTNYLSKEQGEERTSKKGLENENRALLKAFDRNEQITNKNPNYEDIKVKFKVIEQNTQEKEIINLAQITKYQDKNGNEINDDDSIPKSWNEGEDDQDKEYAKLTFFNLTLTNWLNQTKVIENGKEIVTDVQYQENSTFEDVINIELDKKKIDSVKVKFKYLIKVTNEGDIPGYAKEITNYIPEGLSFELEDNEGWTQKNNNIISTNLLENKLIKPGESEEIEVILTWINGKDNIGLKTNKVEISEYYNNKQIADIDLKNDSNGRELKDTAQTSIMLTNSRGQITIYIILGITITITIAVGLMLIKKYVL